MTLHTLPDDLPVLTEIESPAPTEELPVLTEFADDAETAPLLTDIIDEADAVPILTEIVEQTGDVPLLTEVVAEASAVPTFEDLPVLESAVLENVVPDVLPILEDVAEVEELPHPEQPMMQEANPEQQAADTTLSVEPELTPAAALPDSSSPAPQHDAAPVLNTAPSATQMIAASVPATAVPSLTGEEFSELLHHIEQHLSTVFTEKLNNQLEQLQRLAVDLAVSEFKAELPQLLRDALEKHKRE